MKIIFIVMLSLIFMRLQAENTNLFYVIDDGFTVYEGRDGQMKMNVQKIEAAKHSRESLPAVDFPEGNWGAPSEGFQLSLRFDKQTFTNGETIDAIILFRNITNQILDYLDVDYYAQGGPVKLHITDSKSNELHSVSNDAMAVTGTHFEKLFPNTQKKFIELLNQNFNFNTNETYTIYASINTAYPHNVKVESSKVSIKIE